VKWRLDEIDSLLFGSEEKDRFSCNQGVKNLLPFLAGSSGPKAGIDQCEESLGD
jgi:hypothetical protein